MKQIKYILKQDLKNLINEVGGKLFILEGRNMQTEESLHNEFSNKLNFPSYYGKNWDAFNDCISDLSWLNTESVRIVIDNFNDVLPENEKGKKILVEILQDALIYAEDKERKKSFEEPIPEFILVVESKDVK